jgi:hypothetical protein
MTIKTALDNNRPIYTRGTDLGNDKIYGTADDVGHAWVMDGYGSMTQYVEYFHNAQTDSYGYVTITLNNCLWCIATSDGMEMAMVGMSMGFLTLSIVPFLGKTLSQ